MRSLALGAARPWVQQERGGAREDFGRVGTWHYDRFLLTADQERMGRMLEGGRR
jgi:hypothetical protein